MEAQDQNQNHVFFTEAVSIVGEENVVYETSSFSTTSPDPQTILGTVKPKNAAEVSKIVTLASTHRLPLYPISAGNNWGFGSKNPPREGCVLLDLSRMDEISAFDPQLGVITVEPGVTVAHVSSFLKEQGVDFIAPALGAGPATSMIGNALEKGTSSSSFQERVSSVVFLEAILPDGSVYSSYGDFHTNVPIAPYPFSIGPNLHGLFLQNNIGVVTKMTFFLARAHVCRKVVFIRGEDMSGLDTATHTFYQLSLALPGTLSCYKIEGALRSISQFTRYKKLHSNTKVTLPNPVVLKRVRELSLGLWNGFCILEGEPSVVKAAERIVLRKLKELHFKPAIHSKRTLTLYRWFFSHFSRRTRERMCYLALASNFLERTSGKSAEHNPWNPLWRLADPKSSLEDLGSTPYDTNENCGFLLFLAALPATASFSQFTQQAEHLCRSNNIEPYYTLVSMPDRYVRFSLQILFDKADPEHLAQANKCYEELFALSLKQNALPYRVPNTMFHLIEAARPGVTDLAATIRRAVDPHSIMSPGRYEVPKE